MAPQQPPARAPGEKTVTLVFAASIAGQLVPCGCSPDQRGGLAREAAVLKKLRAEDPNLLFVDAGDLLFEHPQAPSPILLQQKDLKARTLARGDELLGAAARAIGERDLALGPRFVGETAGQVPLLDAGAQPVPGARATVLAHAGDVPVGLFAAGLGSDPAATIAARAAELRRQGARLVVLLLLPRGDVAVTSALALLPAAKQAGVDLVVLGHRDDPATDANRKVVGPPPLLAVEGNMQSLLRVDVRLGKGPLELEKGAEDREAAVHELQVRIDRFRAQAQLYPDRQALLLGKVKELQQRQQEIRSEPPPKPAPGATVATATFLPLEARVGEDPAAEQLVAAYDQKVAQLNLAAAQRQPETCPRAQKGELQYVGVSDPKQGCVACHQQEVEFWKQTRHARAYSTLQKVNKQYSLDCIRCHVTGWQQPGGVCRIDRTGRGGPGGDGFGVGRQDVQCEACHGPGSEHVDDPPEHVVARPPETTCKRCHEAENSPHFDFAKYLPYVIGPGHGMPLAKGEKPHPQAMGQGPLDLGP